ncbi:alanine--tRNA ligase [Balneolales bacterium ANBcel1]|nr:alanine--tRNA ligase [Balneolales bacterium ANBcel1]
MSVRSSDQIRQEFFDFFREKEHLIVESAPVVPEDDPTLLFINAGMNPFKPIFLGEEEGLKRSGKVWHRTANTQKCIRVSGKHNDLEEVGHDTYHHTLFEMLGNWSFGDYFKKEAIAWAWELLVDHWGLEPDRLYATVFEGDPDDGLPADDEAAEFWASETPIPKDHILKFGKKDNFWEMGDTGPCGPCSEVHIDLRPDEERKKVDGATLVNQDDPRVMEIWNLVFIQFNRQKDGALQPLPARHVDTGMGFERIVAVLQEKKSNYDTDVFTPLLEAISKRAGIPYGRSDETDIAMRVIADHIRAVSFAITDGAAPSNEERGYVIRRILRRASRYAWDRLEIREAFMSDLVDVLVAQFREVFPEIVEKSTHVKKVITAEETSFLRTLDQGIAYFHQMTDGKEQLSGEDAFKLHDTYGFPVDLTELMARERGISVDLDRFQVLMNEQKDRARKAGRFKQGDDADESSATGLFRTPAEDGSRFTGYDERESSCRILELQELNGKPAVILDRTPFYAESGGQVSDTGTLVCDDSGETIRVVDVTDIDGHRVHLLERKPDNTDGAWKAAVDSQRRTEIERHHSATHLLHAALRKVLGGHVAQKGSLVAPDRLRFDFSHYEPVSPDALNEIEELVNENIRRNIPMEEKRDVPVEEAKKSGATMLFGEKYGERVRIVTFDPDYSKELCGGTHVNATGEIGYLRLVSESSVAAGIRRIEAVGGSVADEYLRREKQVLLKVRQLLGSSAGRPDEEIAKLLDEKKQLEKELRKLSQLQAGLTLDRLIGNPVTTGKGIRLVAGEMEGADMGALKQMGYDALQKTGENTVIILGARDTEKGKVYLMAAVTEDLVADGIKAGALVGTLAKTVGGGGGGQPNLATAGGKQPEKLPEVFDQAKSLLS